MIDINEAKKLIGYCGIYCGACGMYRGRIYAKIAQDFLEVLKAAGYPDELMINPKGVRPDFDFNEFLKGVEYFSKEDSGAYCQESCRHGGGESYVKIDYAQEKEDLRFALNVRIFLASTFQELWRNIPKN